MSLADIKAKINAESQAQIRAIEADADAKVQEINQKLTAEVKAIQGSYALRLSKEEPEVLRRREIVAGIDAKKLDLDMRQRLVKEAFDAALRQLADLPHDRYLGFVHKLMEQAVRTGHEVVLVGKNEKHLDQGWLDSYNGSHQTSLTLSADRLPIAGGFVLRDDKIDVNCSWEMLLDNIHSEVESEVVMKLFS